MNWGVIITPGKNFGRVGLGSVETPDGRLLVQLGSSGPFVKVSRNSFLLIAPLVRQIEKHTGAPYHHE